MISVTEISLAVQRENYTYVDKWHHMSAPGRRQRRRSCRVSAETCRQHHCHHCHCLTLHQCHLCHRRSSLSDSQSLALTAPCTPAQHLTSLTQCLSDSHWLWWHPVRQHNISPHSHGVSLTVIGFDGTLHASTTSHLTHTSVSLNESQQSTAHLTVPFISSSSAQIFSQYLIDAHNKYTKHSDYH